MKLLDKVKGFLYSYFEAVMAPEKGITLDTEEVMYDVLDEAEWSPVFGVKNTYALRFQQHNWAPGLWAGTEGWMFGYMSISYRIEQIDYENRVLVVERIK